MITGFIWHDTVTIQILKVGSIIKAPAQQELPSHYKLQRHWKNHTGIKGSQTLDNRKHRTVIPERGQVTESSLLMAPGESSEAVCGLQRKKRESKKHPEISPSGGDDGQSLAAGATKHAGLNTRAEWVAQSSEMYSEVQWTLCVTNATCTHLVKLHAGEETWTSSVPKNPELSRGWK